MKGVIDGMMYPDFNKEKINEHESNAQEFSEMIKISNPWIHGVQRGKINTNAMGNLFNETVAETICNSEKIIYIQNKKHSESKADMVRKKKKEKRNCWWHSKAKISKNTKL